VTSNHSTCARPQVWAFAAIAVVWVSGLADAQTKTVRIAKQYGISYLPLTIMAEKNLLEEHGRRLGLELKTEWMQFTGGAPMNEAIISGHLDFASGGVGPLLTIWDKTRGGLDVKGVAALNAMPLYLNTINPMVKTIADFSDRDRIALPAVKVSIQAITLAMAAEKVFGPGQHGRLDSLTVTLSHPDGMAQMLGGRSEITAHFTSAPFMYQELEDRRVHKVLNSYEVLDGAHTFNVVWSTTKYYKENPKVVEAFMAALDDAMRQIAGDPVGAAALWVRNENSKLTPAEIEKLIRLPENEWTMVPKKIIAYAEFMHRVGLLAAEPVNWQDVFFPNIHAVAGS
jgi:NitT/TauT family transport system substrate-binding protein